MQALTIISHLSNTIAAVQAASSVPVPSLSPRPANLLPGAFAMGNIYVDDGTLSHHGCPGGTVNVQTRTETRHCDQDCDEDEVGRPSGGRILRSFTKKKE